MSNIPNIPDIPKKVRSLTTRIVLSLGRFAGTTVGLVALFFLMLWTLIQLPPVQNYLITKTCKYLSKELETTVAIQHIDLNFFHHLQLEGFYLQDLKGDTLLYAGALETGFDLSWKLISGNGFDLNRIRLRDAVVNINREASQKDNNLQFVLDYFIKKDDKPSTKKKKPFDLKLQSLILDNVTINTRDAVIGQNLLSHIDWGEVQISEIDLPKGILNVEYINLLSPDIRFEKIEKQPYIEPVEKTIVTKTETKKDTAEKSLLLKIGSIGLVNGKFKFDNFRSSPAHVGPQEVMDYDHIMATNIAVELRNVRLKDDVMTASLKRISANEGCGFHLDKLIASELVITPKKVQLNDMKLITSSNSSIGDTLIFKYNEFERDFVENFEDNVKMEAHFHDAKLALGDLMFFNEDLNNNEFFRKNKNEIFDINGTVTGRVNNLTGENLIIKTKGLMFSGNFRAHDLAIRNAERLNVQIEQLQTDIATLRQLVPSFKPPSNYDKLGRISFDGNFDGFLADFSADGRLRSNLGEVNINMRLDIKEGQGKAKYSGDLDLKDFDLAAWTDNKDLGKVSFHSEISKGEGLTAESASANLKAVIQSFEYKKYIYKNLNINGLINKNGFEGDFGIKDENVDFVFNGGFDFQHLLPEYNFKARIIRIDLQKLNLTPNNDYVLSGDLDLNIKGHDERDLQGKANFKRFAIKHKGANYTLDSLTVSASVDSVLQYRRINIKSDVLNLALDGRFEFQDLPKTIQHYVATYHSLTAQKLGITEPAPNYAVANIDFNVLIKNSKNFTQLIDKQIDTIKNLELLGHFNSLSDSLYMELVAPNFKYDIVELQDVYCKIDGARGNLDVGFGVFNSIINDTPLNTITLNGQTVADSLYFSISGKKTNNAIDDINLNGGFSLHQDYFQVKLKQSNLRLYNEDWVINDDNYIRFGNDFIDTKNLFLTSGKRKIVLKSEGKRGLILNLTDFQLNKVNSLVDDDRFVFDGVFDIEASIEDIFKTKNIHVSASMDTLMLNKMDWGTVRIDADIIDLDSPIKGIVNITKGDQQLIAKGFYTLPNTYYEGEKMSYPGNYLNIDLFVNRYPLLIAKYLIGEGVSDVDGKFDAKTTIYGYTNKPGIKGDLRIYDAKIKIDYLNTTYYIKDEKAKISSTKFDATGAKLYDELGNVAYVTGGITHNHFMDFGVNCRMKSPRVLMLNTTKKENPLYYGTGIGSVDANFTGSFNQTNIEITAKTAKGTKLSIPVSTSQSATGVTFLKYVPQNQVKKDTTNRVRLNGINFEMALSMTEDAEAKIIFDEKSGDIIKGRGNGDVKINVTRTGDFTMYGGYTFNDGEYLFTIPQLFVNKPFKLREGGTLRWTGNPLDAQIEIEAEYSGLSAATFNLLTPEDLQQSTLLKAEARKLANIDLGMQMKGKLLKPDISFKINFPNLTGDLQTIVNNRMRVVSQDQNELNRQVFGLVVMGSFLPSSGGFQNQNSYVNTAFNTLSGFVSNQLANYVNDILKDVIKENGIVSGVDIDLNYQRSQDSDGGNESFRSNQVQFKPRFNLFNDKLAVDVGVVGGQTTFGNTGPQNYINGDFSVEYALTADRKLKIRAYNRGVIDINGSRNRTGLGFVWRKEFDTFKGLFKKKQS